MIVVLVNGAFAFAQEYRADRAGRRLRELIPARVIVRRDGRRTVVDAAELVAGDIVLLEAGTGCRPTSTCWRSTAWRSMSRC